MTAAASARFPHGVCTLLQAVLPSKQPNRRAAKRIVHQAEAPLADVMAFRQQTPKQTAQQTHRSACVARVHGASVTLALALAAAAAFQCGLAAAAPATSACPTAGAEKMVVVTTTAGGSYYSWPECAGEGTTLAPINATAQQEADDEAANVAKKLADAQASFDNRTAAYKAKCDADPTVAECAATKSQVDALAAELVKLQAALDTLKSATVTKL